MLSTLILISVNVFLQLSLSFESFYRNFTAPNLYASIFCGNSRILPTKQYQGCILFDIFQNNSNLKSYLLFEKSIKLQVCGHVSLTFINELRFINENRAITFKYYSISDTNKQPCVKSVATRMQSLYFLNNNEPIIS